MPVARGLPQQKLRKLRGRYILGSKIEGVMGCEMIRKLQLQQEGLFLVRWAVDALVRNCLKALLVSGTLFCGRGYNTMQSGPMGLTQFSEKKVGSVSVQGRLSFGRRG